MSWMCNDCRKLKSLNLKNFKINGETKNMFKSINKKKCKIISDNKKVIQLFNSS